MMNRMRICLVTLLALAYGVPALAEDAFPLTKAAPADVFMCHSWRHDPKREFLDKDWAAVFSAVRESGAIEEVWNAILPNDESEDATQATAMVTKMKTLFAGVDWSDLCGNEGVMMGRVQTPMTNWVLLCRGSKGKVDKNYAGLKAMLSELKKHGDETVKLEDHEISSAKLTTLRMEGTPLSLSVGESKDVIVFAMGDQLLKDALGLLNGDSKKPALVDGDRYKKAFEGLEPPTHSKTYFDGKTLFAGLRTMMDAVAQGIEKGAPPGDEGPGPKAWIDAGRALLDDFAVIDYSAKTSRTEGMRVFEDARTVLTDDAKKHGAYPLFAQRQKIEPWDKYIPKGATSFSVGQGINARGMYEWMRGFITKKMPGGQEKWAQIVEPAMNSIGLNLERDVFSWLDGPSISMSMASSNPLSGGDFVWMHKVTNGEIAEKKVRSLVDKVSDLAGGAMANVGGALGGMGGGMAPHKARGKHGDDGEAPFLSSTPVRIGGKKGFYEIRIQNPMLAMFTAQFAPVWGVSDGYLWVASSKAAVAQCLETAGGERDSIKKSKRFKDEAIMPSSTDGMLLSVSFEDESLTGENLKAALGAFSMIGMMTQMNPAMGQAPPQVTKILNTMASVAGKLTPVADRLNFFQSTSSYETAKDNIMHKRTVNNYRKPPVVKSADDDDDTWGDEPKTKKANQRTNPKARPAKPSDE